MILVINIVMMLCIGTISVCYVSDDYYNYYDKSYPILLTIIFAILFGSVISMRATMKSIEYAFPNERLMSIHFINFPIWIGLISVETVLGLISGKMDYEMETATPE